MGRSPIYSHEPDDSRVYTEKFNDSYGRFAQAYDLVIKAMPFWQRWIGQAIPHIEGPRVLEASCGTGWLLAQYGDRFQSWAIDLNDPLIRIAANNVTMAGSQARIQVANVGALPYHDGCFDSVVCTMAFSGYPDGRVALSELRRVMRSGGKLNIVDINYPKDVHWPGWLATRAWMALGDIIRDLHSLLADYIFRYTDKEIGCFGSVHLVVAFKR